MPATTSITTTLAHDDLHQDAMQSRTTRSKAQATRKTDDQPVQVARHRPYPEAGSRPSGGAKRGRPAKKRSKKNAHSPETPENHDFESESDFVDDREDHVQGQADEEDQSAGAEQVSPGAPSNLREIHGLSISDNMPGHQSSFSTLMPPPVYVGTPSAGINSPEIPHQPSGSLLSLADGPEGHNARPPYPYSTLIRYAIEGSPRGKLTLAELYAAIEKRFPWFSKSGSGWKNSIRHNLSLNKTFIKVPRPLTEPGKGSYWSVNPNAANEPDPQLGSPPDDDANFPNGEPQPEKKRRGRARKAPLEIPELSRLGQPGHHLPQLSPDAAGGFARYEDSSERAGLADQQTPPIPRPMYIWDGYGNRRLRVPEDDLWFPIRRASDEPPYNPQNNQMANPSMTPANQTQTVQSSSAYSPQPQSQRHTGSTNVTHFMNPPSNETAYYPAVPNPGPHPIPYPGHIPPPGMGLPNDRFSDDRPDKSAPRTIYNHSAGVGGMFGSIPSGSPFGPPPLDPVGYGEMYGRHDGYPGNMPPASRPQMDGMAPHIQSANLQGDTYHYNAQ